MDDFKALLIDQLEELRDAERQWIAALPAFAQAAHAPALRQTLESALARASDTDTGRLQRAFQYLKIKPLHRPSKAIRGLLDAAHDTIVRERKRSAAAADAALIIALQKIKRYEICAYACARTLANRIGDAALAAILADTEQDEFDLEAHWARFNRQVA